MPRKSWVLVFVLLALTAASVSAQRAQRPPRSPHETVESDVDGCHFAITYGRPSKRERVIWGALVPWGKWWMPGADASTVITTSKAIVLGGLTVPAGSHTIYMWPDEKTPKLIINKETGQ